MGEKYADRKYVRSASTEEELRERASVIIASTPPGNPTLGDIWIDSETKKMWVVPPLEVRTQSEDVEEPEPTYWRVPGDSINQTFETRDAALARAWEITPAGENRPEPLPASAPLPSSDTWGADWISENTMRLIGYTSSEHGLELDERVKEFKRAAIAEMTARLAGTGMVLDLKTMRAYTTFNDDLDQYRVEIVVGAVPR